MKLDRIAHLFDDPGPFASAYVDASRDQQSGNTVVELQARAAADALREQGAPAAVAELVQEALTESTHEGAPVSRCVVATERGVLFDALTRSHRTQPICSWDSLPDLLGWIEDESLAVPYVLALVDHEGGQIATFGRDPVAAESTQTVGESSPRVHKVGGGGWAHLRLQRSIEEVWARNAREVVTEIERQVRIGPSLVVLAGDPQSRHFVREGLGGIEAEIVELSSGGRAADGGDDALQAEIREVLREQIVAGNLREVHEVKERLGRGESVATGIADVTTALVRGQVDRLLIHPTEAASYTINLSDHPGLSFGSLSPPDTVRADRALVAAACLTDADVTVVRTALLFDTPAVALLRWHQTG